MTAIDSVRKTMQDAGGSLTVKKIMDRTGLNVDQIYTVLSKFRRSGVVLSTPYEESKGREKKYWLADMGKLEPDCAEDPPEPNVPIVHGAMRRVAGHVGNPFAGLLA